MRRLLVVLGALSLWSPCVFALDATLDVSQYVHSSWKIRDGFPKGYVQSLAQTADGYLWLGTVSGLFRFDGIRDVPWQPPPGEHLPSEIIYRLLAAHDGRLWIGTFKGLASWKDGVLTHYPELEGLIISGIAETPDATIWVAGVAALGTSTGKLCEFRTGTTHCQR